MERSEIIVGSHGLWQADYDGDELVSVYPIDGVWKPEEKVVFDAALQNQTRTEPKV